MIALGVPRTCRVSEGLTAPAMSRGRLGCWFITRLKVTGVGILNGSLGGAWGVFVLRVAAVASHVAAATVAQMHEEHSPKDQDPEPVRCEETCHHFSPFFASNLGRRCVPEIKSVRLSHEGTN